MIPETIGRYEVQCLLGEGAFGQVYAARDPVLSRAVAIKVLRDSYSNDASFMERFRAEATSLAALTHHNIAPIYDLLQSGSQHGMIMELVRGHTLEQILHQKSRLGVRETLAVVCQAVSGLGYVHRQDVVHRDIKPSNIMLTGAGVLKIMDFGIARVQGAKRLTQDGSVLGTLAYAAPEQIKSGEGESRSDQYSLACVIYEMLCGRLPFEAATEYELMQAHIARPPEPCSAHVDGVPEAVNQALLRAMAKTPAERFDTVEEFGHAIGADAVQLQSIDIIRDLVGGAGIPPIPQRVPSSESRPVSASMPPVATPAVPASTQQSPGGLRRNTPLLVMGAAAVVTLGVAGFILFDSRMPGPVALPPHQVDVSAVVPAPSSAPPPVARRELETPKPESKVPSLPVDPPAPLPEIKSPETKLAENGPVPPQVRPRVAGSPPSGSQGALHLTPFVEVAPPEDKIPGRSTLLPPEPPMVEKPADKPSENAPPNRPEKVPDERLKQALKEEKKPETTPMPSGSPSYQGWVIAWLSATTILVRSATGGGAETLKLFGTRDKPATNQKEADTVRDQLESFLAKNGREAMCFTRYSTEAKGARSLCFIDKKDIGLWAIENKLGQASGDAPANYPRAPR